MKKLLTTALAATAMIATAAPASAQVYWEYRDGYRDGYRYSDRDNYRGYGAWRSINARQAQLDRRIDAGVRRGDLTPREAVRLRAEFREIAYLEARYRRTGGGLSMWERQDLDRRFDRLSARIRFERNDWEDRTYRGYRY